MSNLIHDYGLDIFDDDRTVAYYPNAPTFALPPDDQSTMLRRVRLWGDYTYRLSLRDLMENADTAFEEAALFCKASVPYHIWGLKRETGPTPLGCEDWSDLIPTGYMLAVDMEIIDGIEHTSAKPAISKLDLDAYKLFGRQKPEWRDAKIEQFAIGTGRVSKRLAPWLLDIEPCIDKRYSWPLDREHYRYTDEEWSYMAQHPAIIKQ